MNARLTRQLYKQIDKPLNGKEILDLVNGQANVVLYPDLKNITDLNQILSPYDSCFILYMRNRNSGHWCCVNKVGTLVEFFDPYGSPCDSQLKYCFHKQPYLSKLMFAARRNHGYQLYYNPWPFQHLKDHIKSCGRWSALRIILKDMPLLKFKQVFLGKNSDEVVAIITDYLL